ncbi:MAG: porin family protein [Gemmatimonadota bacterium]
MNRRLVTLVAAAVFALVAPLTLNAQSIYISGGATFPTGDFGDFSNTGWMGAGGVLFDVGPVGLSVGAEGFYGQNNTKDEFESEFGDTSTKLYGGMGIVVYSFQTGGKIQPYVFGGAGLMAHKFSGDSFDETESAFGYQAGAGIGYPVSEKASIYGEGRYMGGTGDLDETKLFGIFAGVVIALGS